MSFSVDGFLVTSSKANDKEAISLSKADYRTVQARLQFLVVRNAEIAEEEKT